MAISCCARSSDRSPIVSTRPRGRLGSALLTVLLLFGVIFIAVHHAQETANNAVEAGNKVQSASNLHQIDLAIRLYANDRGGQYPDSFETLLLTEDIPADVFVSPGSTDTPAACPTTQAIVDNLSKGGHLSYRYLGCGLTNATTAPDAVIAYEEPGIFPDGGNVLYADGRVGFVDANTLKQIARKPTSMP